MLKSVKNKYYAMGTAVTLGALGITSDAKAADNTFSTIGENISKSMETLPGFVTAVAYMLGILLAILGVMKIKDHVENPTQTPLKEGAIRLAVGGGLFALPLIVDAMSGSVLGDAAADADVQSKLFKVGFDTDA